MDESVLPAVRLCESEPDRFSFSVALSLVEVCRLQETEPRLVRRLSVLDIVSPRKYISVGYWLADTGRLRDRMIERRLKTFILLYLWVALAEDTALFIIAWVAPQLWFRVFHATVPAGLEVAFLRRSAGQWAAFALAQGITLWRWRTDPVWLAVAAGIRFSDLFTDLSYILAVPSLTTAGWVLLLPPALLNLIGVLILLRGYRQAVSTGSLS